MKRIFSRRGLLAILALVATLLFAYQSRIRSLLNPPPATETLTDIQHIDTLREQFNRDQGQPRLILLVSPT